MEKSRIFNSIPDTVFVTDAYGYILDFNRSYPYKNAKKGMKINHLVPGCLDTSDDTVNVSEKIFKKQVSPIHSKNAISGYTVMLSDVTELMTLTEQRRETKNKLNNLVEELNQKNSELQELALQTKELTEHEEQLRVAQIIHDDIGHSITELFTIAQMCIKLRQSDPERYLKLIRDGKEICRHATLTEQQHQYGSLKELLQYFAHLSRIKVNVSVSGTEPSFLKNQYMLIERICKEAYHNTLDHSFADMITITAELSESTVTISFTDNGSFHGEFEKGFGLSVIENDVISSGGKIEYQTENGQGFGITVTWRNQYGQEN